MTKYCRSSSSSDEPLLGRNTVIRPVLEKPDPRPDVDRVAFDGSRLGRDSARRMDWGTGDIVSFVFFYNFPSSSRVELDEVKVKLSKLHTCIETLMSAGLMTFAGHVRYSSLSRQPITTRYKRISKILHSVE